MPTRTVAARRLSPPAKRTAVTAVERGREDGRLGRDCAIRAEFADAARRLMARQPASAYVVERAVRPALDQGRLSIVPDAPAFERSAFAIFPASPIDAEIQDMALAHAQIGLRVRKARDRVKPARQPRLSPC